MTTGERAKKLRDRDREIARSLAALAENHRTAASLCVPFGVRPLLREREEIRARLLAWGCETVEIVVR